MLKESTKSPGAAGGGREGVPGRGRRAGLHAGHLRHPGHPGGQGPGMLTPQLGLLVLGPQLLFALHQCEWLA
jgi:hypothetical protein